VDAGNIVHASDTTGLVVITQLQPISVLFTLPQQALAQVAKAMSEGAAKVLAYSQGANGSQAGILDTGTLTVLDNQVDPTTGTIKVKGSFANEDRRLWPGQFVNVIVTLKTEPAAVVVPTVAIQAGQQGDFAFVVKPDQTVDLRTVTVDRTAGTESVVKDGLKPGETVITDGQLRLVAGSRIKVKSDASQPNGSQVATR
jgi:multidrug efflux system membrane fusion protein